MSEWSTQPLMDVIELIGGGTPKTSNPEYWDGDIPWLSVVDFNTGRKFVSDTEKKITNKGLTQSSTKLLNKGDIIISARGTVGAMAVLVSPMTFNQSCYGIRGRSGISITDYVYYLVKDAISGLQQIAHGGVFDTITRDTFKDISVLLPSLPEQKAIAAVLSSLDDKIDLLHRQNKTLEAMAATLFRQWFVEEAQEDWEERPLSLWGAIICGKTPSKSEPRYFGGDIPFIKIPDMHGQAFICHTEDSLSPEGRDTQPKKTIQAGAICVSCIATVGLVSMTTRESQTNQQINSIVPEKDEYRYFLFLFMKSSYDLLHAMASGGTATLNLNTGNFSTIAIPFPGDTLLEDFHKIATPIFQKIFKSQMQIRTLEKLRDTLLPKLMSGEVRVALDLIA